MPHVYHTQPPTPPLDLEALRQRLALLWPTGPRLYDHTVMAPLLADMRQLLDYAQTLQNAFTAGYVLMQLDHTQAERLVRAEEAEAALRPLVQLVAEGELLEGSDNAGQNTCNGCAAMLPYEPHAPGCPVAQARAALIKHPPRKEPPHVG